MERRGSWNELRGTPSFKEQREEKQPKERSEKKRNGVKSSPHKNGSSVLESHPQGQMGSDSVSCPSEVTCIGTNLPTLLGGY